MLDSGNYEKVCPSCKEVFYPADNVAKKTFCGEEFACLPSGEKHNAPDCQVYHFCSEECLEKYISKVPACTYVPGWKRLMEKISKVSSSSGIAGSRQHNLHKCCK